jgi:hypothetical protein
MARISVMLDGGIGNLLFQYAAALTLRNKYAYEVTLKSTSPGLEVRLETYVGHKKEHPNGRNSANQHTFSNRNRFSEKKVNLEKLCSRVTTKWCGDFIACEAPYSPRIRVLKGYFQHPTWFTESLDQVLNELTATRSELQDHIPSGLTSVHLRRSDYVRLGWELPFEYYENSFRNNPSLLESPVAVFSDDKLAKILLEKELSRMGADIYESPYKSNESAKLDFFTISQSANIIMSNSTYCWWATKLACRNNPYLEVICPEYWLPGESSNELIDSKWRRTHL